MEARTLVIGLAHLAPTLGALDDNRALLDRATATAAGAGCGWVVSGELVTTGYDFVPSLGVEWVESLDAGWASAYAATTSRLGIASFVQLPVRDELGVLRSSLVAIDGSGAPVGRHDKIAVIPGAESWATPGDDASPVTVDGLSVGLLVCADAHPPGIADLLAERGADLFVSSAAWAPGHHGPDGEWESISARTGRPVVVCNRTGPDRRLDFTGASSAVAIGGERVLDLVSDTSVVFVVELAWAGDGSVTARYLDTLPVPPR